MLNIPLLSDFYNEVMNYLPEGKIRKNNFLLTKSLVNANFVVIVSIGTITQTMHFSVGFP